MKKNHVNLKAGESLENVDLSVEMRNEDSAPVTTNRKVVLFWTQRFDQNEFTETFLKPGESFKKTKAIRLVPTEEAGIFQEVPIYSLKRGKRIYYTTDLTKEDKLIAEANERDRLKLRQEKIDKAVQEKQEEKHKEILDKAIEKVKKVLHQEEIVIMGANKEILIAA